MSVTDATEKNKMLKTDLESVCNSNFVNLINSLVDRGIHKCSLSIAVNSVYTLTFVEAVI